MVSKIFVLTILFLTTLPLKDCIIFRIETQSDEKRETGRKEKKEENKICKIHQKNKESDTNKISQTPGIQIYQEEVTRCL